MNASEVHRDPVKESRPIYTCGWCGGPCYGDGSWVIPFPIDWQPEHGKELRQHNDCAWENNQ